MRKLFALALLGLNILSPFSVQAQETSSVKTPISVFTRESCKHCQEEKEFLIELGLRRNDIIVNFYDLADSTNYTNWQNFTQAHNLAQTTPVTLVGDTIIEGFSSAQTTGKRIEELLNQTTTPLTLEQAIQNPSLAKVDELNGAGCNEEIGLCDYSEHSFLVDVPFLGPTDLSQYSLPTLSVILGFIDGFNPCAMWVLVTFLVVLTHSGSRKRMFEIAGIFILAEAIMYYLILNVWFTTWNFVGLNNIVTPLVGLISIGGGTFFLYEWRTSDGTCKVVSPAKRAKTSSRIKALAMAEMTLLTFLGIIGLAFSVNVIEFVCSVGIPQAFTKILDLNQLSFFWRQIYMAIYIFFYMFDDFIVFGIAIYSIDRLGMTTKYSKICNFVGGLLMILLGFLLIFKPEALIF